MAGILWDKDGKLAPLLHSFSSTLGVGLPTESENAYKIIPIALDYYATKLEAIQKAANEQDNEYGFARRVQAALSDDLDALIGGMRSIAKEIKTLNDSKNDDWEKVPNIIEKDSGIITLSLVKFRDDLIKAKNLVLGVKYGGPVRMTNIKKMLDAVEQTKIFKIELPSL